MLRIQSLSELVLFPLVDTEGHGAIILCIPCSVLSVVIPMSITRLQVLHHFDPGLRQFVVPTTQISMSSL